MSKGLIIGLSLIAITMTGVLRPIVEFVGIRGYTGFIFGLALFWTGVLTTIVSAIRLARRPRAAETEK